MKKIKYILIFIVLLSVIIFVAGPFISIYSIKDAISDNNPDKLSEFVDFDILRKNIKKQLTESWTKSLNRKKDIFSGLKSTLGGLFIDELIDSFITPRGLAELFKGKTEKIRNNIQNVSSREESNDLSKSIEDYSFKFSSMDKFVLELKPLESEEKVVIMLNRYGVKWKLTQIILNI